MSEQKDSGFVRALGPLQGVTLVVGTVIGSGIFAVPQQIAERLGGYGLTAIIAVWIFCGLLSLAGALSYAELGAMLPRAGGQYVYLSAAYGPVWGFLYGWMEFWVARAGSVAALAVVFARYFDRLVHFGGWMARDLSGPAEPLFDFIGAHAEPFLAITIIAILSCVNTLGVRWGGAVQVTFTTLKVAALVGIVLLGFCSPAANFQNWSWPAHGPDGMNFIRLFGLAMVASLWAYDGWANGTTVAEEMRDPQRTIPLSLLVGTLIIMVIYLSANLAYHSLLTVTQIQGTKTVAADAAKRALGPVGAGLISAAAMISTFGATNGTLLSGPRIFFAMARDRLFFHGMGTLHARYGTPHAAIVAQAAWSVLLIIAAAFLHDYHRTADPLYDTLFTYVIFASWLFYGMTAAALFVLRARRPDLPRPYKAWGYPVVPAFFVLVAIGFLANTLVEKPAEAGYGLLITALGLPAYVAWNRGREKA